jgi:hypothetical protein
MKYNKDQEFDGGFFFVHCLGLGRSEFHELFFPPFWHARHPRLHIPLVSGKTWWHHFFTQYTTAISLSKHYAMPRKRIIRLELSNEFPTMPLICAVSCSV